MTNIFSFSLISMDLITNWYNTIYLCQQKFWLQFGEELDQREVKTEGQFIIVQLQMELTGRLSHSRKGEEEMLKYYFMDQKWTDHSQKSELL